MIKVGDRIPDAKLFESRGHNDKMHCPMPPKPLQSLEIFGENKRVVLFGVPGAFTSTCSGKHLPGYVALAGEIKAKGVDEIVCVSVNDGWVMNAWGEDQKVGDAVRMIGDGEANFAKV